MRSTKMLSLSLGCLMAVPAFSVNLVQNGSFETGDFTSWTATPAAGNLTFVPTTEEAISGKYSLRVMSAAGSYNTIEQVLATTAGQSYTVSLWVKNYGIEMDRLRIGFEGQTIADFDPLGTGVESWQLVSVNVQAQQSGSLLSISGYDGQAAYYVDDIRVEAVPEPATLAALTAGGLGLLRRRRENRS